MDHFSDAQDPAWLVGGRVRDMLAESGRAPLDTDLAVDGDAVAHARAIARRGGGSLVVLDQARCVARVVWPDAAVGPTVPPPTLDLARLTGPDILADLRGRDFTINAMGCALGRVDGLPNGLLDPLGGASDLRERRVRMTSPGALDADPLRLLRGPRVALEMGFRLESATADAIRARAPRVGEPARERVRDEVLRMMGWATAPKAVALLDELALATHVGLDGHDRARIGRLCVLLERLDQGGIERRDVGADFQEREPHPASPAMLALLRGVDATAGRLGAHLATPVGARTTVGLLLAVAAAAAWPADPEAKVRAADGGGLLGLEERLRLAGTERGFLRRLARGLEAWPGLLGEGGADDRRLHRYFRAAGDAGIGAAILAVAALAPVSAPVSAPDAEPTRHPDPETGQRERPAGPRHETASGGATVTAAASAIRAWFLRHREVVSPEPYVDGATLMEELGLAQGPEVGVLLAALREAQAAGDVTSRAGALVLARRLRADL